MADHIKLLLIEDVEDDALLVLRELRGAGFEPEWSRVCTTEALHEQLAAQAWDIVLSDFSMPRLTALEALGIVKQHNDNLPVLVVSGSIGENRAVEMMRAGVADYIMKDNLRRLPEAVRRELREARERMEKRHSQIELQKLYERFSNVLATALDGFLINTAGGEIVDVNPAYCAMTGFTREEVLQKTVFALPSNKSVAQIQEQFRAIRQNGHSSYESFHTHKNGATVALEISTTYVEQDGGLFISFLRDITERKQHEAELRKLSRAVEQNPALIVITALDGVIEYCNPKFCEVTGYANHEVLGKHIRLLKSGRTNESVYKDLWSTILSGSEWSSELLNRKKDGTLFWVSISISPVKNENDELQHFVAILQDITDKKRITEDLIAAKEKAEEMNKVKSYFFANMSHELRTPMIGILGYTEILSDALAGQPELVEMVQTINAGATRLTNTLNMILEVSKLELGKKQVHPAPVDITKLLQETEKLYGKAAQLKGLFLKTEVPPQPCRILTDEVILEQILRNLVNNAIKFTDSGGILLQLTADTGQRRVALNITDTGIGIPYDKQEVIWEDFRQVSEGLSRRFEGTGLGLTLVKRFTELLQGTVYLKSIPGKGSTFTVVLPLQPIDEKEAGDATPQKTVNTGLQQKERLPLVLYVEDDPTAVEVVRRILRGKCKIDHAPNGKEGLKKALLQAYDAVFMDINLGKEMDGVSATKALRLMMNYYTTPIIAITAFAMDGDREEFLAAGCSHYISKPFRRNELIELVESIFEEKTGAGA